MLEGSLSEKKTDVDLREVAAMNERLRALSRLLFSSFGNRKG